MQHLSISMMQKMAPCIDVKQLSVTHQWPDTRQTKPIVVWTKNYKNNTIYECSLWAYLKSTVPIDLSTSQNVIETCRYFVKCTHLNVLQKGNGVFKNLRVIQSFFFKFMYGVLLNSVPYPNAWMTFENTFL